MPTTFDIVIIRASIKRVVISVAFAASLVAALASAVHHFPMAKAEGSSVAATERRTMTERGVPLDEPLLVNVRGVLFRIPTGYVWPPPDARGRVNNWPSLSFAFWMPTRRYLEIDKVSYPFFRPREPGRDRPGVDEYVVDVRGLTHAVNEPGYITPLQRYRNRVSIDGEAAYGFEQQFGLLRFWSEKWPNAFTRYRHLTTTDPQIILDCSRPDEPGPNPLCSGHVYFESDNLAFFVVFSRNDIARWRENVIAARDLALGWRVPQ
jgi:hypothetical protein